MCGINGFNFENKKLIHLMNETIKHRGPDFQDFKIEYGVSLGHVRLSILDLSSAGNQPMKYNHLSIVFNGEIYNFKEIREELIKIGYDFTTHCDTEVILKAYDCWKEKCLSKFNGMWAFCIFNSKTNELFLSRDRFGKKPLYYSKIKDKFFFSSEIKSLLKTDIPQEIDKNALEEIFTFRFAFGQKTIFKNIKNVLPGHYIFVDSKTGVIKKSSKYYELKLKKTSYKSLKEAKIKISNLIDNSVKLRMVSDVPVACLLSGGLDSSLITYYAKKYNKDLNTYSIGFDTTNELLYAKIVSKSLDTKHHEIKVSKDNILNYLDDMIYHMDEPIGADPGFLPIFVLSKEVAKDYKVVLTGDGADEIFTGYDRYKLLYYGNKINKFPIPNSENEIIRRLKSMKSKNSFESFAEIVRVFGKEELYKLGLKENYPKEQWDNNNILNSAQIFDIKTLLPKDFFMKADKMSSAFGLEQRTPFMDYRIVEEGLSLPQNYRLKIWNEKYILKQIAKEILPKEISKRRKHGFNVPIDYWFENVLADKLRMLLDTRKHNLYNKEYVLELLVKIKESKSSFKARNVIAQKLWTILVFEMWYKRFIK